MKNEYLNVVIAQLEQVSKSSKDEFGNLNYEQLNWKPHPKKWSVGQCLDHLIVTNKLYIEIFKKLLAGNREMNFFEKRGWLLDFWGKMVLKSTLPEPTLKAKTMAPFEPAKSDIPDSIVEDFVEQNRDLAELIKQLDSFSHSEIVISSPVAKFITYTLKTACTVLGNHGERHFNQAKRVFELEAFPK